MSENINCIFPREQLNKLIEHARNLEAPGSGVRTDAAIDDLYKRFSLQPSWMHGVDGRADGVDALYVARQLEHIKSGVQNAEFPVLKSAILVPFDTTPDDGAQVYTVTYATQAGRVRVTKDMRGIIPQVDVATSQATFPILSVLLAYGYTLQEVRGAIRERKPLPTERAMRCREQIERELDAIALMGHVEGGLKGLFTLTGTATFTTPNGSAGTKGWDTKTSEEILSDWNSAVSQVVVDTLEIERPNTTVLPTSCHELVTTKRVGDGTSDTIATFFKRNNPHIKQVESSPYLESSTSWTGKRMVNYEKSPLKVAMILPVSFEQLSPDVTSTETNVTCHARTAGVIAHRPKSIIYSDEI